MFRLCLDNGLPAKPFKFVDHFDDLEKTDDYKNDPNNKDFLFNKTILLNAEEFKEEGGKFLKINFANNQLWIEFEDMYFACENLSEKTIDYITKNNSISLAFAFQEDQTINFWRNKKVDII